MNNNVCPPTPIHFGRFANQFSICLSMVACCVSLTITGCGSPDQITQSEQDSVTPKIEKPKTETVAVSAVTAAVSPATQSIRLPDADATPEEVCTLFVKHLNSGARVKAEQLLTSTALATTAKAGLYLQPIGDLDSKVTIEPAVYATGKKKLAQVGCRVSALENGRRVSDELTWVIRKSTAGWRILGFMLKSDNGVNDFLSFENIRDVDAILQMSAVESRRSTPPSSQRQANSNSQSPQPALR